NISASPFAVGKPMERTLLIAEACREHGVPFAYVNQVGANTELIFDGDSRAHAADGRIVRRARAFEEDLLVWDTESLPRSSGETAPPDGEDLSREPEPIAQIHDALVLGIRDYVAKTGPGGPEGRPVFEKALVGLSGGIDS